MKLLVNALSAVSGGGWTYLVNLMEELERDPRGMDVSIVVSKERFDQAAHLQSAHCRLLSVRVVHPLQRMMWEQLVLPVVATRYDVLYCVADIAPVLKTSKTIVAMRNLNIYDRTHYDTVRLRVLAFAARLGARGADRVIFPSNSAAEQISTLLEIPPDAVDVVPHGIDASRFRRARREHAVVSNSPLRILIPAAVERHKNIEVAIGALRHTSSNIEFQIAGSDSSDPEYRSLLNSQATTAGQLHRVRFLGSVAYDDMPGLYARSFAALLPSKLETFGHPILEAMAASTPLIVPDLPIFREIAGDAGWYFDASSEEDLAATIDEVQSSPEERQRRVEIGSQRVEEYTWRASIDRLSRTARSLLA